MAIGGQRRPVLALGMMLLATFFWGALPVMITLSGGVGNGFLWTGLFRLGAGASYLAVLSVFYPSLFFSRVWVSLVAFVWRRREYRRLWLLVLVSGLELVFYSLALRVGDVASVVLAVETWPVWVIVALSRLRGEPLRETVSRLWPALLFCSAGAAIVTFGRYGAGFESMGQLALSLLGVGLGLLSAALIGCRGLALGFGLLLAREGPLAERAAAAGIRRPLGLYAALAVFMTTDWVNIVFMLGVGLAWTGLGGPGGFSGWSLAVVFLLGFTACIINASWFGAVALSGGAGINLVGYFGLVVSLVLVIVLGWVEAGAWWYAALGGACVLAGNLVAVWRSGGAWRFKLRRRPGVSGS